MRRPKEPRELHRKTRFETFEERLALSAQSVVDDFLLETHTGQELDHHYADLAPADAVSLIGDFNLNLGVAAGDNSSQGVQTQLSEAHELTGVNDVYANYGFDGAGQTIAIIDSGIAYDHDALGGGFGTSYRVVGGWDFAENDANPYDDGPAGFHGTHVAGIVGSDDATHRGVASGADLVALRVFDDNGAGYFSWVEDALQWVHDNRDAFENPITTVNLSLGTSWNADSIPSWAMLEDEFSQLEQDGIFISVSAGNSFQNYNTPGLSYPAASPYVIPVASADDTGFLSYFSQRSDRVLAAPGSSITSTVPDHVFGADGNLNDFGAASGTSMAAPYVAGASVLVRQAMEFVGIQNITQDTIYDHFRNTADMVYDAATSATYHRINVQAAIDALMPTDDYGSDATSAFDLGTLNGNSTLTGQFETVTDADFFTFTAGQTGTISFAIDTNEVTAVDAQLVDGIATFDNDVLSFDVTAGESYIISFQTTQAESAYDISVTMVQAAITVKVVEHEGISYSLDSNGQLSVDGVNLRSQTKDFEVSSNGSLIWLGTDGTLQRQSGQQWQTIDENVVKFVVLDNAVFSLDADNWLSIDGSQVWTNTQDFSFSDDGALHWLSTDGLLQRRSGGTWETTGENVVKYVVPANNAVYSLDADGWLSVEGRRVWGNTADFNIADDGSLYWLSTYGLLQRNFQGQWSTIDEGVTSIQLSVDTGISYQKIDGSFISAGSGIVQQGSANTFQAMASSFGIADMPGNAEHSVAISVVAAHASFRIENVFGSPLENYTLHAGPFESSEVSQLMRMAVFDDLNELDVDEFSLPADGGSDNSKLDLDSDDELTVVDSLFDEFADAESAL